MSQANYKSTFIKSLFFLAFAGVFTLCFAKVASAATLSFSPASSNVSVGDIVSVKVVVGTGGEAINSADGTIQFSSDMLDVMSISKTPSIFSLWVEDPSFDNSKGTITFDGGIPNPGYTGQSGQVLSIVFKAKKKGTASVIFSDSSVRKNDGLGTDILSGTNPGTITITSGEKAAQTETPVAPPVVQGLLPPAPKVTSSTHPEQNKWYNSSDVSLQWDVPNDITAVETLVGNNPSSLPTVVYNPPIGNKNISKLDDGVWYFHIRFKNSSGWGPVTNYKIQIDTTPPESFKITFPHGNTGDDPRPVVIFNTTDSLSGINTYGLKIDENKFITVSPQEISTDPYSLPAQDPGTHEMLVKAVDFAGNETVQTIEFTVTPINPPQIQDYPSEINEGDALRINGISAPSTNVEIVVKDTSGNSISEITSTLENGNFSFVWPKKLGTGSYSFTARSIDSREAKSNFTTPNNFVVNKSSLSNATTFVFGWLSLIIIIALAIAGIILLIMYFVRRFAIMNRSINRKVRVAESSVHKAFDLLRDNVREQIKTLEGARAKRDLTKEEEKVIKHLQENLTKSEEYLEKEIQDIEDSIQK